MYLWQSVIEDDIKEWPSMQIELRAASPDRAISAMDACSSRAAFMNSSAPSFSASHLFSS